MSPISPITPDAIHVDSSTPSNLVEIIPPKELRRLNPNLKDDLVGIRQTVTINQKALVVTTYRKLTDFVAQGGTSVKGATENAFAIATMQSVIQEITKIAEEINLGKTAPTFPGSPEEPSVFSFVLQTEPRKIITYDEKGQDNTDKLKDKLAEKVFSSTAVAYQQVAKSSKDTLKSETLISIIDKIFKEKYPGQSTIRSPLRTAQQTISIEAEDENESEGEPPRPSSVNTPHNHTGAPPSGISDAEFEATFSASGSSSANTLEGMLTNIKSKKVVDHNLVFKDIILPEIINAKASLIKLINVSQTTTSPLPASIVIESLSKIISPPSDKKIPTEDNGVMAFSQRMMNISFILAQDALDKYNNYIKAPNTDSSNKFEGAKQALKNIIEAYEGQIMFENAGTTKKEDSTKSVCGKFMDQILTLYEALGAVSAASPSLPPTALASPPSLSSSSPSPAINATASATPAPSSPALLDSVKALANAFDPLLGYYDLGKIEAAGKDQPRTEFQVIRQEIIKFVQLRQSIYGVDSSHQRNPTSEDKTKASSALAEYLEYQGKLDNNFSNLKAKIQAAYEQLDWDVTSYLMV